MNYRSTAEAFAPVSGSLCRKQDIGSPGIHSRSQPVVLGNQADNLVDNKVDYWPYTARVPLAKELPRLGRVVGSWGFQLQAGSVDKLERAPVVPAGC